MGVAGTCHEHRRVLPAHIARADGHGIQHAAVRARVGRFRLRRGDGVAERLDGAAIGHFAGIPPRWTGESST